MKEQKITIEISAQGQITADAEGFSGEACLKDLERLLKDLETQTQSIERKPDQQVSRLKTQRVQTIRGKK